MVDRFSLAERVQHIVLIITRFPSSHRKRRMELSRRPVASASTSLIYRRRSRSAVADAASRCLAARYANKRRKEPPHLVRGREYSLKIRETWILACAHLRSASRILHPDFNDEA
jgi:hypothetical protein